MNTENKHTAPFINVTPLIDVLLVLLIIFLVISPVRLRRFETKVPERGPAGGDQALSLVVTLDRDGGYRLNSEPAATLSELDALLHRALDGRPEGLKAVFIKAPRATHYGEVVKVIGVMKASGSAPIGMQIENLD